MNVMVNNSAAAADPVVWSFGKLAEDLQDKQEKLNRRGARRSKHGKGKAAKKPYNQDVSEDYEQAWAVAIASLRKDLTSKGLSV